MITLKPTISGTSYLCFKPKSRLYLFTRSLNPNVKNFKKNQDHINKKERDKLSKFPVFTFTSKSNTQN